VTVEAQAGNDRGRPGGREAGDQPSLESPESAEREHSQARGCEPPDHAIAAGHTLEVEEELLESEPELDLRPVVPGKLQRPVPHVPESPLESHHQQGQPHHGDGAQRARPELTGRDPPSPLPVEGRVESGERQDPEEEEQGRLLHEEGGRQ
jgi:hypothetical protein